MSKAIDDLKHEHDAILSALQILEGMGTQVASGKNVDKKDIHNFISFLREFADKCHHGKEEGILFPALTKAGIPEKGGPVGVMLSEHNQGRNLIKDMEDAISHKLNYAKFAEVAKEYTNLLRAHIQKENNVLFPMAEQRLTTSQLDGLYDSFEEHEEKVIGHGRHKELHAILKDLKSRFPT
jgi:hemerythrin-like domain-containing protein